MLSAMKKKSTHPIMAKRRRSRGGVRGHLARRNRALADALADAAITQKATSKDGKLRIPFLQNVPRKVRKEAFAIASAMLGQRGGKARAKKLTAEEQSRIGRKAAAARWKKTGKSKRP
jgi:hypothetical protein